MRSGRSAVCAVASTAGVFLLAAPSALAAPSPQGPWAVGASSSSVPACTITGTSSAETLNGTAGNDVLCGLGGNDTLNGAGGNDVLLGGSGSDVLNGSHGEDTADYSDRLGTVTADLTGSTGNDGETGEGDTIAADVEILVGGAAGDTLTGDSQGAQFGGGESILRGGPGGDVLQAGPVEDVLEGGEGDDTLYGGNSGDILRGGPGADTISGQGDVFVNRWPGDTADYSDHTGAVNVSLDGVANDGEPGEGDNVLDDIEVLVGGSGNDTLTGNGRSNWLRGGPGADVMNGGGNGPSDNPTADMVDYSDRTAAVTASINGLADDGEPGEGDLIGADVESIRGGGGDDTLHGSDNPNELHGGNGNDTLHGNGGADLLLVGTANYYGHYETASGSQHLYGGAGNDRLIGWWGGGGTGVDNLHGGDGDDTLVGDEAQVPGDPGGPDAFTGGDGNDVIYAGPAADVADGGAGNDTIWGERGCNLYLSCGDSLGSNGIDTLDGGSGDDTIDGQTGNDVLTGGDDADAITGGPGNDSVNAGAGNDSITASDGTDSLIGGLGDDSLDAGAGDDYLRGGYGADILNGGIGLDTGDYADHASGVNVDLGDPGPDGGVDDGAGDTTSNLEHLIGTPVNDTLAGNAGDNQITGGSGTDTVYGRFGDDTIDAGNDDDTVYGEAGNDTLRGGLHVNQVYGGEGDDSYVNDAFGADLFSGGAGIDTADFSAGGSVTVSLDDLANDANNVWGAWDNIGSDVERLLGGPGLDTFTGSADANYLDGGASNDTLLGMGGVDTLIGGADQDVLRGGTENDSLSAGSGNDVLDGGPGAETISGGDGSDTVDYSLRAAPVSVTLDGAANDGESGEGDNVALDVETLVGGAAGDTLRGAGGRQVLDGRGGDDTLQGLDGDDRLVGGTGGDDLQGGAGLLDQVDYGDKLAGVTVTQDGLANDAGEGDNVRDDVEEIWGSPFNDNISGGSGPNWIFGGNGHDTISGLGGNDTLTGGLGSDTFHGGDGDDLIYPENYLSASGGGNDTVNGGDGTDTYSLPNENQALRISLDDVYNDGRLGEADNVKSDIEIVQTGSGADTLVGSDGPNRLEAGIGDDTLSGGGGDDVLEAFWGDDRLSGGPGVDTLRGGDGNDTADFIGETDDLEIALPNDLVGPDWMESIENARGGSGADTIIGSGAANQLDGGPGDDRIVDGEGGSDVLIGGDGRDTADYSGRRDDLELTLDETANDGEAHEGDNIFEFEILLGGSGGDRLVAIREAKEPAIDPVVGSTPNGTTLVGGPGRDQFEGGAADDVLVSQDDGPDGSIDCGEGDDLLIADDKDVDEDGDVPVGCETIDDVPRDLSVSSVSQDEGTEHDPTPFVFTVTLAGSWPAPVTAGWTTLEGGTATPEDDYVPEEGTLTIPAGATSATFSVLVKPDDEVESDETFIVELRDASVPVAHGQGQGTILNDDAAPNTPPVADAGGPYRLRVGSSVQLDGTGSLDPDGDALAYDWDLDADGAFDDTTGATPTVSWTQLKALGVRRGPTTVGLRVSDAEASGDDTAPLRVVTVAFDFDNDGDADRGVWRPASGGWYVKDQASQWYGASSDVPVPADYDGDGDADRAVWRPASGGWLVLGRPAVYLGASTDLPVPADYDGDGDTETAVWRPNSGAWIVTGQPTRFFGISTDIPVPGDYDGDGDDDPAVWRPSNGAWLVLGQATRSLGVSTDAPVPADFDDDGDVDPAVWRPSTGAWVVLGQATIWLGANGDRPMVADYDGNGIVDRAVWRPASGGWYVQGQAAQWWGTSTDLPLSIPPAVRLKRFP